MAKVKRSDIADEDIFKLVRESAEKAIETFEKMNQEARTTASILKKEIADLKFDSSKSIDKFTKSTNEANRVQKEAVKIDQELQRSIATKLKAEQELEKLEQQKLKTAQQRSRNQQQQAKINQANAKAAEKQAKEAANEANAYKQLEKNTRELKNESKRLAAELMVLETAGRKNTKEFRQLERQYKDVTSAAQKGDVALKKIDSTVGDNFRKVGDYTGAVNKLKGALGQLGLAFGIGAIVRNAGQTIVEFDQKIADLISITGASGDDLKFYKEQAVDLGKKVQGGAGAVIEAYKLIGSAKPELLSNAKALDAVTQSAITLSQASGMTLPDAATALTDAMNQFGAPAEKAGQFIDALANGALYGSAEIPQVTEALLKFGAVANTSNVPVEESVGLIESLAEKGLKGAEAGTALRNVMLKLSAPDALPKEAQVRLKALGISFDDLKDKSKPFSERLALLKPLLKDNGALIKVFGTENAVAATNLINNTDRIAELTANMSKQGTASKQAEDRTKTLSFAFNELKESWNALILQLSSGEGTSAILVEGLSFIAHNLGTIIGYVMKAVLAWGSYRTILAAVQAKNYILNGGLKETIVGMKDAFTATKKTADGAKEAGENIGKAGKAMSAVPWIAVIGLAIELATALYDIASGAKAAREQQELLNRANAQAEKNVSAVTARAKAWVDEQKRLLDLEIRNRKAAGESEKTLAAEKIKREKAIEAAGLNRIKYAQKVRKQDLVEAMREFEIIKKLQTDKESYGTYATISPNQIKILQKYAKEQGLANWQLVDTYKLTRDLAEKSTRLNKEIVDLNASEKEFTDLIDESNVKLSENSIAHENNGDKINAKIPKIKEEKKAMQSANDEIERTIRLINETQSLIDEVALYEAEQNLQSAIESQLESIKVSGKYQLDLIKQLIEEEYNLQKAIIERKYLEELDAATNEQEVINARTKRDFELGKLEKKRAEEERDIQNQLEQEQEAYANNQIQKTEEVADAEKKTYDTQKELVKLAADYFIEQSERKIRQIEKEITAAEKQYDYFKGLAESGNITAKESLAEQQRIINEANKRKEQEQKRMERIKMAEAAYNSYIAHVEKGDKNPLLSTIKDISLLNQFVAALPTFYEGTDTTVGAALGAPMMSGRDGYVVRVDKDEKILNPTLSKMTGDLTTSEIAKIAQDYQTGKLINYGSAASIMPVPALSDAMLNKFDQVIEAIENAPTSEYNLGAVTQESFNLIRKQQRGSRSTYTIHKVRK